MPQTDDIDVAELKRFALAFAIFLPVVFMGILPWLMAGNIPLWPILISSVLITLYLFAPGAIQPIYRAWMRFAHLVGRVNTFLILCLLFYFILTPAGLVLRLSGKLQYKRTRRDSETSFWMTRSDTPTAANLKRPF